MTVLHAEEDDDRASLLGFLLGDNEDGVRPLLPIDPGLAVLYGLNGAGKSRTLDDMSRWWAGSWNTATALVQLPTVQAVRTSIDWYGETGRGDWYVDWARRANADETYDLEDILRGWLAACLTADEATALISESWEERLDGLQDEWMDQRLILVRAVGTGQERSWVSVPAFMTGNDLRRYQRRGRTLRVRRPARVLGCAVGTTPAQSLRSPR